MTALLHAISIGTLATWLSVSALGTVGLMVPGWLGSPSKPALKAPAPEPEPFSLGAPETSPAPSAEAPAPTPESSTTDLPTPPELPSLASFEPLPEIPPLPAPRPSALPTPTSSPAPTRVAPSTAKPSTRSSTAGRQTSTARTNSSTGTGTGTSSTGTGSALSDAARLAAGTMTPPSYPSYCRSHNQTGTVIVEFTVDTSGKVISAYAKSSSNWPLLDNEAVRTVRRWKFPPGGVMRLQRPIVFKLS